MSITQYDMTYLFILLCSVGFAHTMNKSQNRLELMLYFDDCYVSLFQMDSRIPL